MLYIGVVFGGGQQTMYRQLILFASLLHKVKMGASPSPEIEILPNTNDVTLFERGNEYRKVCRITGLETGTGVRVIWERDGNPIRQFDGQLQFQLLIDPVEVADQGNYACRVVLSSPHSPGEIGPISAGTLTIIGLDAINVSRTQVAVVGLPTRLNCSYPGALITWFRNGMHVPGTFMSAIFSDEGEYECDLWLPKPSTSTRVPVMLHVFVPVTILSTSEPLNQTLDMYQSVTLFVNFMGRLKHELTVQWFKDGIALEDHDARIFTSFVTRPNKGMNTMLSLPSVGTSDAGIYRVVISSQISVKSGAPAISSNQEVSFHINVTTALFPITCSYPSIINGTIESNHTVFLVGDNAMVQCSRGSHFIIICIENGTWTPPPESYCEARSRESLKLSSLFVLFISHTLFIIIY